MMGRCFSLTALPLRQQRRISNFVSPVAAISSPKAGDTGLALKIGSREASPFEFPGSGFPQAVSSPAGAPGGRVERVGSATASFLHLGRRPSQNAAQHVTQPFCPVAPSVFGSAHVQQHEGTNARKAVNYCQGFGNVCRA